MVYRQYSVRISLLAEQYNDNTFAENQLVARARCGEKSAFDELFLKHKDRVFGLISSRIGGDRESSEEAVGSVFLCAYRALGKFRGDSSFLTWLCRIAINEANARIRHKRRSKVDLCGSPCELNEMTMHRVDSCKTIGPDVQLIRSEEIETLERMVRALPEPYRTPVILRYWRGLPSPKIADALKRPAGTVRYQLSRGLELLRDRLRSE